MNQPKLGKKIFELRREIGLTQGELAENCNISLRTVQRVESGEVTPRSHTIKVIFSALDCELNNASINNSDKTSSEIFLKLFNLKILKKISVLFLVGIFISVFILLRETDPKSQKVNGWILAGSRPNSYIIGLDKSIFKTGNSSAFFESIDEKIEGFGTLMQTFSADDYLGERIKMTAYVHSKNVSEWSGIWLRIDSKQLNKVLSFDNMENRPIKGDNDWTKCEIILDVPEDSGSLNFGVLLVGTGKIWFDNITFETVDKLENKTTGDNSLNKSPINLDFKE